MQSRDLKPAFGCDHDGRRFPYCGRRVELRYFGRVMLEREGYRTLTIWFGEPCRTPLEAWLDAVLWAAAYVPPVKKEARSQKQSPMRPATVA